MMDLSRANVVFEHVTDDRFDGRSSRGAQCPPLGTSELQREEFPGHIAAEAVEHGNVVSQHRQDVGVMVKGHVSRRAGIGSSEGKGLVAISLGSLMRQYQLRCCTSARRKMIRPGFNSSLSVTKAMECLTFCADRNAKWLIFRTCAKVVEPIISNNILLF
jgi:hypothetical protein